MNTTGRPVMNPPAQAEAGNRDMRPARQADPAAPCEELKGTSPGKEARPEAATAQNWPPRFTMTPEGAIRLILLNFRQEQNEAKTELALLTLINEVYEQGKRDALTTGPAP